MGAPGTAAGVTVLDAARCRSGADAVGRSDLEPVAATVGETGDGDRAARARARLAAVAAVGACRSPSPCNCVMVAPPFEEGGLKLTMADAFAGAAR